MVLQIIFRCMYWQSGKISGLMDYKTLTPHYPKERLVRIEKFFLSKPQYLNETPIRLFWKQRNIHRSQSLACPTYTLGAAKMLFNWINIFLKFTPKKQLSDRCAVRGFEKVGQEMLYIFWTYLHLRYYSYSIMLWCLNILNFGH